MSRLTIIFWNFLFLRYFFFVTPTSIGYHIFPQFFGTFYSPLEIGQNFNFLTKNKTSEAHNSVSSENQPSTKKIFFLCHSLIYPAVSFSHKSSELFIPLFNLAKILIFLQQLKLVRLITLSVLKIIRH